MRRLLFASAVLLVSACGGQSSTDACVMKLDVKDMANVQLATTATAHAELQAKSGSCPSPLKGSVTWSSSNTSVLSILTSNDSTASLRGLKTGSSIVAAWLTLTPSVRDSVTVNVTTPTDAKPFR